MIEGLLQPSHLLLILLVAFFAFGAKKLPELGKGLAQGIRSFKDGIKLTEQSAASEIDERTDATRNDNSVSNQYRPSSHPKQ
jgi:sec-independent protein translocase protein TatA